VQLSVARARNRLRVAKPVGGLSDAVRRFDAARCPRLTPFRRTQALMNCLETC